jgi:rsbT co-antagonist protein RsbR
MNVVKLLQKNRKQLLDSWMQNQLENSSLREDLISNEELRNESEELFNIFIGNLNEENLKEPQSQEFSPIYEMLGVISISRARRGFSANETGQFVKSLKDALFTHLVNELNKNPAELAQYIIQLDNLFDSFTMHTFQTFIKGREEVILRQTDEISEISTPVIRVWDGILALPIIGTLDSARTQTVMENLLQEIVATGSGIAILDISGVPAVDSLVAQHLIKTVSATRLMGAECIISGIRPEIAQTVVHLGIDLSQIITKSTLSSALKTAFDMLRLEVKKKVIKIND